MKPTPLTPRDLAAVANPSHYEVSTFTHGIPDRRAYPLTFAGLSEAKAYHTVTPRSILFVVGRNGVRVTHANAYPGRRLCT